MDTGLLSKAELCVRWGVCESTLYAMRRDGRAPAPVRLGRGVRWRLADVQQAEAKWVGKGLPRRSPSAILPEIVEAES